DEQDKGACSDPRLMSFLSGSNTSNIPDTATVHCDYGDAASVNFPGSVNCMAVFLCFRLHYFSEEIFAVFSADDYKIRSSVITVPSYCLYRMDVVFSFVHITV
ncbi:MAG: hypothetical protein LBH60_00090, partial [Prevotellaceae bacterium]|nr:hypothetical protein [Prevotellaceae bacterium]